MEKSPVKWLTDSQYTQAAKSERTVAWADSQVGVEEVPRYSNNGPKIREYLHTVGLGGGYYWCAAFVKWCCQMAVVSHTLTEEINGMAWSIIKMARATGRARTMPARGRLGAYAKGPGLAGHTWVCLSGAVLGVFRTIEGNSNDNGSANGYKVAKRFRTMRSVTRMPEWAFVDLD